MRNLAVKLILVWIFGIAVVAPQGANAAEQQQQVPMLQSLSQLSPNQLQVTYDQPVDRVKGMTPTNYWIQSTTDATPTGIATLGKNDQVNASNSLTSSKVTITAPDNQNQRFILTFNQSIPKGMTYKLIICYVTTPGAPPYSGDNGSAVFVGQ